MAMQLPPVDEHLTDSGGRITPRWRKLLQASLVDISVPWTQYTPTVTAVSGTFTTVSGIGRYRKVGTTIHLSVKVTITTNGTAGGGVVVTLPFTADTTTPAVGSGREDAATGAALQGKVSASAVTFFKVDNTYPGGTGYEIRGSITYEAV